MELTLIDLVLLAATALTAFNLGRAWCIWQLNRELEQALTKDDQLGHQLRQILAEPEESQEPQISRPIDLERIDSETILAYDQDQRFLVQAKTVPEIMALLSQRFPDQRFRVRSLDRELTEGDLIKIAREAVK